MPIPAAIRTMGLSAHLCGTFPLPVNNPKAATTAPRANLTRTFHCYLELTMQAKHDANIRGYCNLKTVQVVARKQDGKQVPNSGVDGATALRVFYIEKSRVAAEVTRDQMVQKWGAQKPGAAPVFVPGVRVDASVQMQVQRDGYQYEISYWYENQDIYVLYHCYPSR